MSEPRKVRLCSVADIEVGAAKRIDVVDGDTTERIAVARVGEDWYAVGDECSHADYSLGEGEVDEDECTLECWKHGTKFSLETGEALTLPATQPVAVYALTIEDSEVFVTLGGSNE